MHIHYTKETDLNWMRVKKGLGFTFLNTTGKSVSTKEIERFEKLSIPPAWTEVVVNPNESGHIQAIGVDVKGRKQYIYHPEWVRRSQEHKFDQMIVFGERLPTLREAVSAHMREHSLTQERILATVVWLLEHTFIRIGNELYARENQSYGITTMREKHVSVTGNTVNFSFMGKSGVFHELGVTHPRVAQTIKACLELPGYEIFQYLDNQNTRRTVSSEEVNEYLKKHTGEDFSAKEFRTWGGSVLAGAALYKKGSAKTKMDTRANISDVVEQVSDHLGNTRSICRTYYIHPLIIESYEKNTLVPHFEHSYGRASTKRFALTKEEHATWSLIKGK